jgi:purine-nucleoside phosphorylase
MSTHIGAQPGDVAPVVLMPGDPLRAKWIAENFLDDPHCYSVVRGMYGYTGTWRGERVSVQGSGMGQPSASIYVHELFSEYDVDTVIRVGSCGALTEKLRVRDVVLASGACTDSSMNRIRFDGWDYAPVADFGLLSAAYDASVRVAAEARETGDEPGVHVGLVLSIDSFYHPQPEVRGRMADHGVLAVEMEASALYTQAARFGRRALTICTVADHIVTGEETTAEERQQTFSHMVEIALRAGFSQP